MDTKNYFKTNGETCKILYKTNGLEHAIHLLLKTIKNVYPVVRINILCGSFQNKIFIPIFDSDPNGLSTIRKSDSKFPIIAYDSLAEPVIINNLEPYKKQAIQEDASVTKLPFYEHSALIRLPLFVKESFTYLINFWSNEKNIFSPKVMAEFQELIKPLKEELYFDFIDIPNQEDNLEEKSNFLSDKVLTLKGLEPVINKINNVAKTNCTVLILGETGVGKEVAAQTIHKQSKYSNGPFISLNCGSIPQSLIESELFGYVKGAFTGALSQKAGYFEYANNGTIFLDEIGEMPLTAQVHLLRVLDQKCVQRIGNPTPIPINVRVIAATNRDLKQMIKKGTFRQDLYYRLTVYPITIPPLRERKNDIIPLIKHFIKLKNQEMNIKIQATLTKNEIQKLINYSWPGNIRELRQLVERAIIDSYKNKIICPLSFDIPDQQTEPKDIFEELNWPTLQELEKSYIQAVLKKTKGKLSGKDSASELLGIHYTTLRAKLKQ